MIIVLDSNVFISALIKEGLTRKIITMSDEEFLIPEYFLQEVRKHEKDIMKKSKMSKADYDELISLLLNYIEVVPNEISIPFKEIAFQELKNIDPDDTMFLATALAYKGSFLWSDDKKLKNQNKVKVVNTQEIMNLID